MDHPVLVILMRVIHILCAICVMGGLAFIGFCLRPVLKKLDESIREEISTKIKARFTVLQWSCFAGLLISGGYNWMISASTYKAAGPAANALIGTKFLLALAIMAVAWAYGAKLIKSDKTASMINIHLALVVVILAAILRWYRMTHGA